MAQKRLEPSFGSEKQNPLTQRLKVPQGQTTALLFLTLSTPATQANSTSNPRTFAHAILANWLVLCPQPLQLFLQASAPSSLPPDPPEQTKLT